MTLYNLVAYVKRARNRKKVFQSIEKEMMPSEIVAKIYGKSSNTYFNLVSRALAELKKKNPWCRRAKGFANILRFCA